MKVFILGYDCTKFSFNDISIESILSATSRNSIINSKINKKDIDGIIISSNNDLKYLSAIISESLGISPKISYTIEHLCSSGTNAIISAFACISSGLADVILVAGADIYNTIRNVFNADYSRGELNHPIFWGSILTSAYKRKYKINDIDLAYISLKNHQYGYDNQYAYSKKKYTLTDILKSKKISHNLRLLECSRICTGGASIVLASEKYIKQNNNLVSIIGIGQKTMSASFTNTNDFTSIKSTKFATKNAFDMCKINSNMIDVAEIHDAFAICEPLAIEDIGLAKKGKGIEFSKELLQTGNRMINPRGGLIGSGHPISATGIAQTIEITQQLQNNAGKRQVNNAKIGLVHNMSAAGTSSTILILKS